MLKDWGRLSTNRLRRRSRPFGPHDTRGFNHMSHRTIITAGALALTTGATILAASPASAEQYAGPNGAIGASCAGQQISSGRLFDSRGKAHPTARWRLYSSKADGGTKCLTVSDHARGRHAMSAMIRPTESFHEGAKKTGTFQATTSAVSVKKVANRCIGITAEITDGHSYQRNIDPFRC